MSLKYRENTPPPECYVCGHEPEQDQADVWTVEWIKYKLTKDEFEEYKNMTEE